MTSLTPVQTYQREFNQIKGTNFDLSQAQTLYASYAKAVSYLKKQKKATSWAMRQSDIQQTINQFKDDFFKDIINPGIERAKGQSDITAQYRLLKEKIRLEQKKISLIQEILQYPASLFGKKITGDSSSFRLSHHYSHPHKGKAIAGPNYNFATRTYQGDSKNSYDYRNSDNEEKRLYGLPSILPIDAIENLPHSIVSKDGKIAYNKLRNVNGDGHCYYRAFLFAILEQTLNYPDIEIKKIKMRLATERLDSIVLSIDIDLQHILKNFVDRLNDGSIFTAEQLISELNHSKSDAALIQASRHLIACWLIESHSIEFQNNQEFRGQFYETDQQPHRTLEEYCRATILNGNTWADGPLINLNVLGELFDINSTIFIERRMIKEAAHFKSELIDHPIDGSQEEMEITEFNCFAKPERETIALFFKGKNHYQILYPTMKD